MFLQKFLDFHNPQFINKTNKLILIGFLYVFIQKKAINLMGSSMIA